MKENIVARNGTIFIGGPTDSLECMVLEKKFNERYQNSRPEFPRVIDKFVHIPMQDFLEDTGVFTQVDDMMRSPNLRSVNVVVLSNDENPLPVTVDQLKTKLGGIFSNMRQYLYNGGLLMAVNLQSYTGILEGLEIKNLKMLTLSIK